MAKIVKFVVGFARLTGIRPCSLMDRISDSGSDDLGSIPNGGTVRGSFQFWWDSFSFC